MVFENQFHFLFDVYLFIPWAEGLAACGAYRSNRGTVPLLWGKHFAN